jgi:protein-tyrosine phosphatase
MAEAIARTLVDASEVFVVSAGVGAIDGVQTSTETVAALAERGIPCEGVSTAITSNMIRKADLVLCMTASHRDSVRAMAGGAQAETAALEKIQTLDPDGDIADPIGQGQASYEALADHLVRVIPARIETLLSAG